MSRRDRSIAVTTVFVGLIVLTVSQSGCATVVRLSEWPSRPQVYGGTRGDIQLIRDPPPGWEFLVPVACVDLPFSLVADTIVLPSTVFAPSEEMCEEHRATERLVTQLHVGDVDERRSAARVLGFKEAKSKHAIDSLTRALQDEDEGVRQAAAEALEKIDARQDEAQR